MLNRLRLHLWLICRNFHFGVWRQPTRLPGSWQHCMCAMGGRVSAHGTCCFSGTLAQHNTLFVCLTCTASTGRVACTLGLCYVCTANLHSVTAGPQRTRTHLAQACCFSGSWRTCCCVQLHSHSCSCSQLVGLNWALTVLLRCRTSRQAAAAVLQYPDSDVWGQRCTQQCVLLWYRVVCFQTDLLQECFCYTAGCPVLA